MKTLLVLLLAVSAHATNGILDPHGGLQNPTYTITSGKLTLNGAVIQGDNSGSRTVPVATVTFVNGGGAPVSTVQVLTTGTSATYTTPGHVRQLKIRM